MTKAEIRELSRALGLPTWDRPASPCLSSRFPYGTEITLEGLQKVEAARTCSMRWDLRRAGALSWRGGAAGSGAPRRSRASASPTIREIIDREFKKIGFRFVAVDLKGFRSGSLNEGLIANAAAPANRCARLTREVSPRSERDDCSTIARSDGVVIFMFAVEPSTTSTLTPVRSTRSASSVATIPSLQRVDAPRPAPSRRKACGVCACHSPVRATVAAIAPVRDALQRVGHRNRRDRTAPRCRRHARSKIAGVANGRAASCTITSSLSELVSPSAIRTES